jgi:hypothetical protein
MPKIAYMTIDDAPSVDFLDKINYLYKKKIPAIIFCLGENLVKHKSQVIKAIRLGFIIGNHCYEHKKLSESSLTNAKNQILSTDQIINGLYKKARVKRPSKFFRFPYGDTGGKHKGAIKKILSSNEFIQPDFKKINYKFYNDYIKKNKFDTFWTFNIMEYHLSNLKKVYGRFDNKKSRLGLTMKKSGGYLSSKSNEIVIIHDHQRTTKWFYKIVDELLRRKIKFIGSFI